MAYLKINKTKSLQSIKQWLRLRVEQKLNGFYQLIDSRTQKLEMLSRLKLGFHRGPNQEIFGCVESLIDTGSCHDVLDDWSRNAKLGLF